MCPRYGLISKRQQNCKANISRALTPAIFDERELFDLWCNIPAKFHSNQLQDEGGIENTS